MAYRDFTIARLAREFGVGFVGGSLFATAPALAPGAWLTEALALAEQAGTSGARACAERLVSPLLLELARRTNFEFAVASGRSLEADPARGLSGTCDFALSFTRVQLFIQAPVCCVAVRQGPDTVDELAECAALLLGAARLNERENRSIPTLYGCTTTGIEWRFLKFERNVFTIDEAHYLISDLGQLLGVLQHIVDQTRPHA